MSNLQGNYTGYVVCHRCAATFHPNCHFCPNCGWSASSGYGSTRPGDVRQVVAVAFLGGGTALTAFCAFWLWRYINADGLERIAGMLAAGMTLPMALLLITAGITLVGIGWVWARSNAARGVSICLGALVIMMVLFMPPATANKVASPVDDAQPRFEDVYEFTIDDLRRGMTSMDVELLFGQATERRPLGDGRYALRFENGIRATFEPDGLLGTATLETDDGGIEKARTFW